MAEENQMPQNPAPQAQAEPKKSRNGILISAAVLLVVIILIGAAYAWHAMSAKAPVGGPGHALVSTTIAQSNSSTVSPTVPASPPPLPT
jgi:hypothetical protein